MTEALAFVRASWLTATSYRINAVLSVLSFPFVIVPVYFIAGALDPVLADAVRDEGGDYFAFVVIGIVAIRFMMVAVYSLPQEVSRNIGNGALEAYLATPIRLPTLLAGLVSYDFLWTVARVVIFLAAGMALGMRVSFDSLLIALLIFVLLVAAHVPFGLIAASCVLVFRNTTPLPNLVLNASALLGGVYYPAHIVPSWLQYVSGALPMTYGLRAFRTTLLDGAPLREVTTDVMILVLFVAVLLPLAIFALRLALRYARAAGSLTHY
jgi:ABC-2 type transport system permease protein